MTAAATSDEVRVLDLTRPGLAGAALDGADAVNAVDALEAVDAGSAQLLGLPRRVVVVDEVTTLMAHHQRYERLAALPQVDKVICVAVGGLGGAQGRLQQPSVMVTVAAVLWVGDRHGVTWSGGADRAYQTGPEHVDGLQDLIRALRAAEVFDEAYRRTRELPYHTASVGLAVEWIDVAEQVLTQGRVVALRSITATGTAARGPESASRLTEALDRAVAPVPGARHRGLDPMPAQALLQRARAQAETRLHRAASAVAALAGVTGLLGAGADVRHTVPGLVAAGHALGEHLAVVTDAVRRLGASVTSGHPPVPELVDLGLPQPSTVDRAALAGDVEAAVSADLRAGHGLPEVSAQLRRFAVRAAPHGAVSARQALSASGVGPLAARLTSPPPVTVGWPTPLALLTGVTLLTCFGAAVLAQSGGVAGPVLSLGWMLITALLLARCSGRRGSASLVVVDWALVVVGAAAALGVISGRVLSLSGVAAGLSVVTELVVVVTLVVMMLATAVVGWTVVIRRWSRQVGVAEALVAHRRVVQLLDEVISAEWRPAPQRRQLADSAQAVASVIDDVAQVATELLMVLEQPASRDGLDGTRAAAAADHGGGPELVEVLRQDLAELAILALQPCLDEIRRGGPLSVQAGQHAAQVRRLFTDYSAHLQTHGVHAMPAGITDEAPRRTLRAAMWHQSGEGRRILRSSQHSELVQLCAAAQVRLLNAAQAEAFRFAPHDARDILDAGELTATTATAVGVLRLVPLRSGLVEIMPVRAGDPSADGSRP